MYSSIASFPARPGTEGNRQLESLMDGIVSEQLDGRSFPNPLDFQGRPVPVDAPTVERLREIIALRTELCLYSDIMRDANVVHFVQDDKPHIDDQGQRLLTHYYSFVFFEDWRQALWSHRLIRDHLRYSDEIMCGTLSDLILYFEFVVNVVAIFLVTPLPLPFFRIYIYIYIYIYVLIVYRIWMFSLWKVSILTFLFLFSKKTMLYRIIRSKLWSSSVGSRIAYCRNSATACPICPKPKGILQYSSCSTTRFCRFLQTK